MKLYLSARFSRAVEMRDVRDVLNQAGHEVTSRWIDIEQDDDSDARRLEQSVAEVNAIAALEDIAKSDGIVFFAGNGQKKRPEKGARHVEFGVGLALNKMVTVIGEPTNAFHWLPNVERYASVEEFLDSLETD